MNVLHRAALILQVQRGIIMVMVTGLHPVHEPMLHLACGLRRQ